MGMDHIKNIKLQKVLEEWPEQVTWSSPREVLIFRGLKGQLGLKLHTYQGKTSTYTVITKVKDECNIQEGNELRVFDRVVAINSLDITKYSEEKVLSHLKSSLGPYISLKICQPERFRVVSPQIPQVSPSHSNVNPFTITVQGDLSPVRHHRHQEKNDDCSATNVESIRLDSLQIPIRYSPSPEKNAFKRGVSQVSSGSDQSGSRGSYSSNEIKMGKPNKNKFTKKTFKIVKTHSQESDELEPLKPTESPTSPNGHPKYSMFNVGESDRGAQSLPVLENNRTVSVNEISIMEDPIRSLPTGSAEASWTSDAAVCPSCSANPAARKKTSRVVKSTEGLEEKSQMVHSQRNFLKQPHLALWSDTKVVTIEKGRKNKFGFNYKVMVGKNSDDTVELYTLVETVARGGPADGKLGVGDWIRSVNGNPLQSPKDAFVKLNDKVSSYRLVIQRPVGFSSRSDKRSYSSSQNASPSPVSPTIPDDSDIPEILLPGSPNTEKPLPVTSEPVIPKHRTPSPTTIVSDEPPSPLKARGTIPTDQLSDRSGQNYFECRCPVTNVEPIPSNELPQNVVLPINTNVINGNPFPKSVKLPSVRIFVCGSEAVTLANLLLGDCFTGDVQRVVYNCVKCSMTPDSHGNLHVSPWCSDLYSSCADQSNLFASEVHQSESGTTEKVERSCRHCGNEILNTASGMETENFLGTMVNAEIYVVPDDKFFHNCCSYLFTKSSVFLLTFDGAKLLRSAAGETTRLQNLSHTIRCIAGEECPILSCGLIESDLMDKGTVTADEVRTLFYTSYGHQLQMYNLMEPILINTNSNAGENMDSRQQIQKEVWLVVMETVNRQRVLSPCLSVLEHLMSLREHEKFVTETVIRDRIKKILPNYEQDVHQSVFTELMSSREILLGKCAPICIPQIESLVLLDPTILLDKLISLITSQPKENAKQKWIKMAASGNITHLDFLSLCKVTDQQQGQQVVDFLEGHGLLFRRSPSQSSELEYYIPYFALEPSSTESPRGETTDVWLYLQCKEHMSTVLYFRMMFYLGQQLEDPRTLNIQAVNCCMFTYQGMTCIAFHQKLEDRVKFIFRRTDKSVKLPFLHRWLRDICRKVLASELDFILGPPCPLGDDCRMTTRGSLAVHTVDIAGSGSSPQYCGETRVDTHRAVRPWWSDSGTHKILDLPWSVFNKVCQKLLVGERLGRDWKGLAGHLGFTVQDILLYERLEDPAKALLSEWTNGSLEKLMEVLAEPDMERQDIIMLIKDVLENKL